jgi:hypothetical protein
MLDGFLIDTFFSALKFFKTKSIYLQDISRKHEILVTYFLSSGSSRLSNIVRRVYTDVPVMKLTTQTQQTHGKQNRGAEWKVQKWIQIHVQRSVQ